MEGVREEPVLDEAQLVASARRGDRRALGHLYDLHAPRLLGRAVQLLSDRSAAEDLVHDVFIEAYRALAQYAPERGSFGAWLGARLRSRAIDRLRQSSRRQEVYAIPETEDLGRPDPDRRFDATRVSGWLAELSPEQRQAIEWAYFGGCTLRDIAERQGVAEGTVKARISRGLAQLRARRAEEGAIHR